MEKEYIYYDETSNAKLYTSEDKKYVKKVFNSPMFHGPSEEKKYALFLKQTTERVKFPLELVIESNMLQGYISEFVDGQSLEALAGTIDLNELISELRKLGEDYKKIGDEGLEVGTIQLSDLIYSDSKLVNTNVDGFVFNDKTPRFIIPKMNQVSLKTACASLVSKTLKKYKVDLPADIRKAYSKNIASYDVSAADMLERLKHALEVRYVKPLSTMESICEEIKREGEMSDNSYNRPYSYR